MRSAKAKTVIGSFREEGKLELSQNDSQDLSKHKTEQKIPHFVPFH